MSKKGQRDLEAAREIKLGLRKKDGQLLPGPGGRPQQQIRCFHCDRLLLETKQPRWRLKGTKIVCPRCGRDVIL